MKSRESFLSFTKMNCKGMIEWLNENISNKIVQSSGHSSFQTSNYKVLFE